MNFKVLHRIGENLSAVITGRKQFYLLVDVEYLLGSQTWILITYFLIKNVQSSQWLDSGSNMYRDLVRNGLPEQTTLRDPQESECLLKPLKLMPYLFNSLWLLGSKFKKKNGGKEHLRHAKGKTSHGPNTESFSLFAIASAYIGP